MALLQQRQLLFGTAVLVFVHEVQDCVLVLCACIHMEVERGASTPFH